MTTKVLLITHPHTDWTLEGQYQGHIDVPLNDVGLRMVDALVRRLGEESIACVYSSDLQRSYQTAEAVAVDHGVKHIADVRLREGRWEKQYDIHEFPLLEFNKDIESERDVQERMIEVLSAIVEAHQGETVFVVSHWGATNQFIKRVLEIDSGDHGEYRGTLAAINTFEYEGGHWHCLGLNDDAYLDGITLA